MNRAIAYQDKHEFELAIADLGQAAQIRNSYRRSDVLAVRCRCPLREEKL